MPHMQIITRKLRRPNQMFTWLIIFVNIPLYIVIERREPEIDQNNALSLVHHEIIGLDVRMHNKRAVHIVQKRNELHTNIKYFQVWIKIRRPNALDMTLESVFVKGCGDARVVSKTAIPKKCRHSVDTLSIHVGEYFALVRLLLSRDLESDGFPIHAMTTFEDGGESALAYFIDDFVVVYIHVGVAAHSCKLKCEIFI